MRPKIRTRLLVAFSAMLLLLTAIAFVALDRTAQISRMAGELNGRVIDKVRIATDLVSLGQQVRQLDPFLLQASTAEQVAAVQQAVQNRLQAIDAQIASFKRYADNPMEQRLLLNLQESRFPYLDLQQEILARPRPLRAALQADEDSMLGAAFDEANRQARGLAHLAEAEARATREQVTAIAADAQRAVLVVGGLALLVGLAILILLMVTVLRPLTLVTRSLLALSEGRISEPLASWERGDEIGDLIRAFEVFRSNSVALAAAHEESKAAHRRADAMARHDALTGLPNRRGLTAAIGDVIARSERHGTSCVVLLVDLDRFKPVNDVFGHAAGDKVLCAVAERLNAINQGNALAARLGGDEFAIVLEVPVGSHAPLRIATDLVASIAAPIPTDGREVLIGASVGIALWPSDGADAEALLHAADLAMFKAKRNRRGSVSFFEPEMDVQLRIRADLEGRIRSAIDAGHIVPYYQPLIDLRQGTVVGFEVLARWRDGDTIRPPSDFITIAEEAGLMPALTDALLRRACRDVRHWPEHLTLAVNITPAQIVDGAMPRHLLSLLAEEGFAPNRLELEVTENALIGDVAAAKLAMATLRAHAVRFSLDDFGTGYSSLHHLRDLRFDKIKIDRSFIQAMLDNPEANTIVETILGLGRSLNISTIAEGIEDAAHHASITEKGCDFGQGYHFGRPVPASEAAFLVRIPALPRAA